RIISEWLRMPEFLTKQVEINQHIKANSFVDQMDASAKQVQLAIKKALIEDIRNMKVRLNSYVAKNVAFEDFPERFKTDLDLLEREILRFEALRRFYKPWQKMKKQSVTLAQKNSQ